MADKNDTVKAKPSQKNKKKAVRPKTSSGANAKTKAKKTKGAAAKKAAVKKKSASVKQAAASKNASGRKASTKKASVKSSEKAASVKKAAKKPATTKKNAANRQASKRPAIDSTLEATGIKRIDYFDKVRDSSFPQTRLAEARKAALKLREEMITGKQARYYRTVSLIRVPYPTKFGLLNAARVATPLMHILNRLFVVRFDTPEGLKTLLFSPSDIEANRETPFFKNLSERAGPFSEVVDRFLAPVMSTVEEALDTIGLSPEDIDYISYDHLHTQDLRKWLGADGKPGYFPNAKLLVMDQEWSSTQSLLPPQAYWYCPNGIKGVPEDKVIMLDSSVMLGDGVALVQTPGHTEGNHSLVVNTPDGLLVTSENGVSADNYSPLVSRIPGVRQYALQTDMEVILNGNTLEGGLDQYVSMVMEKTLAGPARQNPEFFNVVPSSEMTHYWGFPGLRPSFSFGEIVHGKI